MKKIMMLGGNYFQMSATRKAKELGYYVISVDYLPNNPAHKYADEYYNVSTVDNEAILELAKKLKIDGILAYASDVSISTAAYVGEKLGLPTNPYETTLILSKKHRFKKFLKDNGFFTPEFESFVDFDSAFRYANELNYKFIVKPIDASGCKGITIVDNMSNFEYAFKEAMDYSIEKRIVIERFIQRKGNQYTGDGLIVDGKLIYMGMSVEHFDTKSGNMVPIGESFPSDMEDDMFDEVCIQCQKIFDLLDFNFGTVNLECFKTEDDKIMILEIGPRSGGNLMPDAILLNSGIDMIEYAIKMAVGDYVEPHVKPKFKKNISTYVINSLNNGIFEELYISDSIKDNIILKDILIKDGEFVEAFKNGGKMLGAMLLEYDLKEDMTYKMNNMSDFIKVKVR